jgi:hypothetical protein
MRNKAMKIIGKCLLLFCLASSVIDSTVLAETQLEDRAQLDRYAAGIALANERAEIKTLSDLRSHLEQKGSPLRHLSPAGLSDFVDGLVFSESGLGSMNFGPLVAELDEDQIYAISKLFGVQFEVDLFSPRVG